ncbi:hypothetical protein [Prevotella sp. KH2C16]|uniref:hypothetical protein n=1 Tax=Prevotella sp. KH2C16 TaxID=1855325 RepID=UPI0008EBD8B5|nr:hypothetical protein [Prevotella sp. KH2C16]SFG68319.1 hypothetical protein SAMN05216383_1291 [Prevotella sp. KH2C16]
MKRIILFLIASLLPAGLALAQERGETEESVYVENEKGEYSSKASLKLKPQSYRDALVLFNGRGAARNSIVIPILLSTLSEKRFEELRLYTLWLSLNFDAINKKMAYVGFLFLKDFDFAKPPLTNAEMAAIEKACKKLKFEYKLYNTYKTNDFTRYPYLILFNEFKFKR